MLEYGKYGENSENTYSDLCDNLLISRILLAVHWNNLLMELIQRYLFKKYCGKYSKCNIQIIVSRYNRSSRAHEFFKLSKSVCNIFQMNWWIIQWIGDWWHLFPYAVPDVACYLPKSSHIIIKYAYQAVCQVDSLNIFPSRTSKVGTVTPLLPLFHPANHISSSQ